MQLIDDLRKHLLDQNTLFGTHGYFFKDTFEFLGSGVTDRYVNMFYIRYLRPGPQKIKVRHYDNHDELTANIRLVVKLSTKVDKQKALNAIIGQILSFAHCNGATDNILIDSYSDDSQEIYKSEHSADMVDRDFYLISIDMTIKAEAVLRNIDCDCLCIKNC